MVRADLLDCIDIFLRMYGPENTRPFGGVQMVFVGDLYQLPPVVLPHEYEMFSKHYTSPYFFSAHIMDHLRLEVIELEKVYRQKDQAFVELLNRIRNHSINAEDLPLLNQRKVDEQVLIQDKGYIYLTTTNKKADEINCSQLDNLKGAPYSSTAKVEGDFGKEYFPTAPSLDFKPGAQIMLLNNDSKKRWVNGSIGKIESIGTNRQGKEYVRVRLHATNEIVHVEPFMWEVFRFSFDGTQIQSEPAGTFTQYPFRLAWAITIHKSQGKTFDKVILDIDQGTFAAGQLYVALSRCTSIEGLMIKTPLKVQHIKTDSRIFKFLTHHQYKKAAKNLPFEKKVALIEQAIIEKKRLHMTYLTSNDTKSQRIFIPLNIGNKTYKNKLFPGFEAKCLESHRVMMFHIDRILTLNEIDD
jgi:hypothetical protein